MKEEKNTASECQHDFDSNEESDYCAKGCGEKWSLFTIKSLKQQVADYEAALNFYSLKSNYSLIDEGRNYNVDYKCYELDEETYVDVEIGTKAREVLQKYKGKKCSHPDYNLEGPGVKICKECGVYL